MLLPLLIGIAIGTGVLLALALIYGPRGTGKKWRGVVNAIAVGLALGAMFDLMPIALEQATIGVGLLMRAVVEKLALQDSPLGFGGVVLTQAVVPVGALLVLFLYLTANAAPMVVNGELVGIPKQGWRARLVIPEAGSLDWTGIALLTLGLAMQNLWSGQMHGVLGADSGGAANLFRYAIGIVAALRGIALFGSFVDPARRSVPFLASSLLISAAVVVGVLFPDSMQTILLGVLPAIVAMIVLPIAMGRLLRVIQYDIGLNWQATLMVLTTLAIERGSNLLLARMVQGQF